MQNSARAELTDSACQVTPGPACPGCASDWLLYAQVEPDRPHGNPEYQLKCPCQAMCHRPLQPNTPCPCPIARLLQTWTIPASTVPDYISDGPSVPAPGPLVNQISIFKKSINPQFLILYVCVPVSKRNPISFANTPHAGTDGPPSEESGRQSGTHHGQQLLGGRGGATGKPLWDTLRQTWAGGGGYIGP